MPPSIEPLEDILHRVFGFKTFRPGQKEAITALMEHGRVLCIQPTGHGKSLLYQLPTCVLKDMTVVISPLLALMRDQILHLHSRFKIPSACINSDQTEEENARVREALSKNAIRILFISPEQLNHVDRFTFLSHLNISLLVIDEAHCISTWGFDFRPSYRQILPFVQSLEQKGEDVKILALTATADARVEKDVKEQLSTSHKQVNVLRENMDRPNIHLSVISLKNIASKLLTCEELLTDLDNGMYRKNLTKDSSGIIYCATRDNTELVAAFLKERGVNAIAYHAGLDSDEKREIQEAFSRDTYKVVVATTALGMGIDKAALRFIIHFDIPGSITAYYQEVGRCGRDGLKAQGILLYDPADKQVQQYFIDSALPTLEQFETIFTIVKTAPEPLTLSMIKRLSGLHPTRVSIILAELIEQKCLAKQSKQGSLVYLAIADDIALDLERYTNQHLVKTQELEKIITYAEQTETCRMALLRVSLGDMQPQECGRCDVCNPEYLLSPSLKRSTEVELWLQERPIAIPAAKICRLSEGLSLLDGKLHSPLFIQFMKQRMHTEHMDESLFELLKKHASSLAQQYGVTAIIPLPSRTWKAKESVTLALAEHLQVKALCDLLLWKELPAHRQGELLNNDQRQHNVREHMHINPDKKMGNDIPKGALLLLDDYIGSGASLKEATRALRQSVKNVIVPLTIAAIKWRLGKPGFI